MHTVAGDPEQDVARHDLPAVDDVRFFDYAHCKASNVVFAGAVHARHFGGLSADQRTTRAFATARDALDDFARRGDVELAAAVVIEKEQRLRTERQYVIDAHRDQIDADRIVPVKLESELELRADAVGTGHQHGFAVALRHFEQRTEATDPREHARPQCAPGERLDAFDQTVAGVDVDSGVAIGEPSRCAHAGGNETIGRCKYAKICARDVGRCRIRAEIADAGGMRPILPYMQIPPQTDRAVLSARIPRARPPISDAT